MIDTKYDTLMLAGYSGAEWLRSEQHFHAADLIIEMVDAIRALSADLAAAIAQPQPAAMCGCGDTFGEGSVCANCLAGIDCKPVPDDEPAAVPAGFVLVRDVGTRGESRATDAPYTTWDAYTNGWNDCRTAMLATMAVLGHLERAINIIVDNSHCHMTPHMVCIPEDKWIAAMQLCGGVMPSATDTEERKDE